MEVENVITTPKEWWLSLTEKEKNNLSYFYYHRNYFSLTEKEIEKLFLNK